MDYSEGRQGDLEEPGLSQLRPHGTEWLVETKGIQIDYYDGAKRNLDFIWTFDNPVEQRSPLEYFCAMFPMVVAAFWIEKTNAGLAEMKRKPLSKFEYFRIWGLILAISIGSEKNRRNYWMEELDGESGRIFQPPAFGTLFGMGIRRFEDILQCLSFGDEDCNDPWSPIRPFMDALNNRRQQVINPSHMIVEDELMSSWISRKQDRTADGIPHLTNIIQKPKGVGAEINASSKIDVHNHLRQGLLNIEDAWGTQTWWHRLAATFVGITVIDAMLAYNYERRVDAKSVEDFANDLALSLICNKFDGYELVSRRRMSDEPIAAEPSIPVVPFEAHPLKCLLTLPKYKKNIGSKEGARRKCYVCAAQGKRHNAHYFSDGNGKIFPCSSPSIKCCLIVDWTNVTDEGSLPKQISQAKAIANKPQSCEPFWY
eukprot:Em0003g495a